MPLGDPRRDPLRGEHGDPADTGRLWAVVGPLNAVAQLRKLELQIEPEFVDPVLEFQADGRLPLVPLRFLILAIAFSSP